MFKKPNSTKTAVDARDAKREPMIGVTAMVRTHSGVVVEGVVQDVSDGGLGMSGDVTGLKSGDEVEVLLVIQGQKVGYRGQIRHINAADRTYGIRYASGPIRGDMRDHNKQCRTCKKDYPDDHSFCFRCGQRLVGGFRPQPAPASASKMLGS